MQSARTPMLYTNQNNDQLGVKPALLKVVYHSRKCMKILGFLLKGRGGGGYLKTLLSPRVLTEGLGMVCMYIVTWHGVT